MIFLKSFFVFIKLHKMVAPLGNKLLSMACNEGAKGHVIEVLKGHVIKVLKGHLQTGSLKIIQKSR